MLSAGILCVLMQQVVNSFVNDLRFLEIFRRSREVDLIKLASLLMPMKVCVGPWGSDFSAVPDFLLIPGSFCSSFPS